MSMETWKEEFYPIEAYEVENNDVELLKHSIRKWKGLRKASLEKHAVEVHPPQVCESYRNLFCISTESCALCVRYYDNNSGCRNCPLQQVLGEMCDKGVEQPYGYWYETCDPEPMILALEEALSRELLKENKDGKEITSQDQQG